MKAVIALLLMMKMYSMYYYMESGKKMALQAWWTNMVRHG